MAPPLIFKVPSLASVLSVPAGSATPDEVTRLLAPKIVELERSSMSLRLFAAPPVLLATNRLSQGAR